MKEDGHGSGHPSKIDQLVDRFHALFWWCPSLHSVPAPSHRHSNIEVALASVFHPGSVRLEGWRSSVRRPHYDDEIQSVSMPAGEKFFTPVERRILGLLAAPLFQFGNHESGLGIDRLSHIVR